MTSGDLRGRSLGQPPGTSGEKFGAPDPKPLDCRACPPWPLDRPAWPIWRPVGPCNQFLENCFNFLGFGPNLIIFQFCWHFDWNLVKFNISCESWPPRAILIFGEFAVLRVIWVVGWRERHERLIIINGSGRHPAKRGTFSTKQGRLRRQIASLNIGLEPKWWV